jgi:hypothetical protein
MDIFVSFCLALAFCGICFLLGVLVTMLAYLFNTFGLEKTASVFFQFVGPFLLLWLGMYIMMRY